MFYSEEDIFEVTFDPFHLALDQYSHVEGGHLKNDILTIDPKMLFEMPLSEEPQKNILEEQPKHIIPQINISNNNLLQDAQEILSEKELSKNLVKGPQKKFFKRLRHKKILSKEPEQIKIIINPCSYFQALNQNTTKHFKRCITTKEIIPSTLWIQFQCNICKYYPQSQEKLDLHYKLHNKIDTMDKVFKCNLCGYLARTRRMITRHNYRLHIVRQI